MSGQVTIPGGTTITGVSVTPGQMITLSGQSNTGWNGTWTVGTVTGPTITIRRIVGNAMPGVAAIIGGNRHERRGRLHKKYLFVESPGDCNLYPQSDLTWAWEIEPKRGYRVALSFTLHAKWEMREKETGGSTPLTNGTGWTMHTAPKPHILSEDVEIHRYDNEKDVDESVLVSDVNTNLDVTIDNAAKWFRERLVESDVNRFFSQRAKTWERMS